MKAEVIIGRLTALVEVLDEKIEDAKSQQQELAQLTVQLQQTGREVEQLREYVLKIDEILKEHRPVEWLSPVQAAALVGVNERTVRNWYNEGRLRGYMIGVDRLIRFDKTEFVEDVKKMGKRENENNN